MQEESEHLLKKPLRRGAGAFLGIIEGIGPSEN